MNGTSEQMQGLLNELQSHSKVVASCDSGGDSAVKGGTYIASRAQSEASHDLWLVYYAGLVSAREETSSRR